tara:strand:+ start:365 stop:517 length:153 start_codon:yes stop_codon:yes gene_type:complete
MLDLDFIVKRLKEARDEEDWDLIKEVISYIEEYEEFADEEIDQWNEGWDD